MATVISLLSDAPADAPARITTFPTWSPDSRSRGLGPTLLLLARLVLDRRSRPTWIHAHLSEAGSFLREGSVLLVARALGLGTAATLHGARFIAFSTRHRRLTGLVLGACRVVFTLGPLAAARVAELSPGTPVRVMPNPVDLRELEATQASPVTSNVVFGGEVGYRKGVDRLVEAWPQVRRVHPEATCLLCGPAGDFTADALPEGMTYVGPVSRSELLGLIRSADIACLPSRAEALPMFVLESLGLGTPVVTTAVGELGQLGDAQGVVLTSGEPAELSRRLIELLDSSEKAAEWGRRGAEWIRSECDVTVVTTSILAAYRNAEALA
jgi:glycosyltransferase involved in cell wall biosynthesis